MKRAFSLTELLVVILIIAILASLMFPVFSGAKGKARETACLSNLRQIHIAVTLYQEDQGAYPPNNLGWPGLKPYYKTQLVCHSKPKEVPDNLSYLYLGFWEPSKIPQEQEAYELFQKCQASRGPVLPYIFDFNHRGVVNGYSTGRDFILLCRMDGSVHHIPTSEAEARIKAQRDLPCASPLYSEFNL